MTYRMITPDEIPAFATMAAEAFRNDPQRLIEVMSSPEHRNTHEDYFVWEDPERGMVAGMVVFPRGISVGGKTLQSDLIASVSVPPDQRRRGYANAMMTGGLQRARERELPLSSLWPYSIPFYNRLGYGVFTQGAYAEFPLAEMQNFNDMYAARRMAKDDLPAMQRLFEKEFPRHNGWITRTNYEWTRKLLENPNMNWPEKIEGVVVEGDDGELLAYMAYTLTYFAGSPDHCLTIVEWMDDSTNPKGWRALAGYVAAQRAQARFVRYTSPLDFPLHHALGERYTHRDRREVQFTYRDMMVVGPGMLGRLAHAPEAFRQRGYPEAAKGAVTVQIQDKHLPENETPFVVEIEGGQAHVSEGKTSAPTASADIRTWSELYSNSLKPRDAWRLGRLEADEATINFLAAAFESAPWFNHRLDWF